MNPGDEPTNVQDGEHARLRLASDLAEHNADQSRTWGDADDMLLARYIENICTKDERRHVEQLIEQYPAVRECVELVRGATPGVKVIRVAAAVAVAAGILAAAFLPWSMRLIQPGPGIASIEKKGKAGDPGNAPDPREVLRHSPTGVVAALETRARALRSAAPDAPEVRKLRDDVVNAPIEIAASAWENKEILDFMTLMRPRSTTLYEAELVAQIDQVRTAAPADKSGRSRLSALPPKFAPYVKTVFASARQVAGDSGGQIGETMEAFLLEARAGERVGMIVPHHFWLMDTSNQESFKRIVALSDKDLPIKIVNTRQYTDELVPGGDYVSKFNEALAEAHKRGVEVYAYVNCDGGTKPLEKAEDEVKKWQELFGSKLHGIFFDHQSMGYNGKLAYFRSLFQFTKRCEPTWKIISATTKELAEASAKETAEAFIEIEDDSIICYKSNSRFPRFMGWEQPYGSNRFGALIHNVGKLSEDELKKVASVFGWVYLDQTNGDINGYKELPEYLEKEAQILKQLNTREPPPDKDPAKPAPPGRSA